MLTRSKQRLLANNENINKENNLNGLKRKRSTKPKIQTNKENIIPKSIGYSLRSRSKPKENLILLKQKSENLVNRRGLKEKLVKNHNIIKTINEKPIKTNVLKDNNTATSNSNVNRDTLKEKGNNKTKITTIINNKNINLDINKNAKTKSSIKIKNQKDKLINDPNFIVLIQNKISKENIHNDTVNNDNKLKSKKVKIEIKENIGIDEDIVPDFKDENLEPKKIEKNDQKNILCKPSILKKKDNTSSKRKEKVTFDDKVKNINDSINISYNTSLEKKTSRSPDKIEIIKIDDSSPLKKHNNDLIVPFIRSDSENDFNSSKSTIDNSIIDDDHNLKRKSCDLSNKSLELLAEFNKGGKVQISDILESLNCNNSYKSSTPNNFNNTLLFLEESPINYTRILNEEMSFHTPLESSSFKSPEKEVSTISRNTSFQDSNSLSNFINISPISNSHLIRTDSDISHFDFQPDEFLDEGDVFNSDDKSLYSADELDEKIKKLLSGNDNFNLVMDDDNKNNLRYKPLSPDELNRKRKIRSNDGTAYVTNIPNIYRTDSFISHPKEIKTTVIEELNYDQPEKIYFNQDSSSDDPFGFSKAEKIYKSKQKYIKNEGTHTPISISGSYTSKKESHYLDNVNEILLQEHQQILESKKKKRNRKKIKIEDMEKLDSDDLEEIKKAKDEQMKLFKEIDDYVLKESMS
ncbi:hypothetical protein BCR36DRAFT_347218 [Piromyces finnis]|uniref:Uncharacterized protein n=1 Tax=Piromyces finnis TaxID=1754191 RepID=A0A1Y1VG61_9FUNG|nr:hypothetical protein BCR36DRAFT_347218 [Piromyces finnis]|eukprot:ORX55405.1 hypothetical protein BCR36DRAFT_347218 [Piromyces finnis]